MRFGPRSDLSGLRVYRELGGLKQPTAGSGFRLAFGGSSSHPLVGGGLVTINLSSKPRRPIILGRITSGGLATTLFELR
jgi:hypothetical protein